MATVMTAREVLVLVSAIMSGEREFDSLSTAEVKGVTTYCEKAIASLDKKNEASAKKRTEANATAKAEALALYDVMIAREGVAMTASDWCKSEDVLNVVSSTNKFCNRMKILSEMGMIDISKPKKSSPNWYKAI